MKHQDLVSKLTLEGKSYLLSGKDFFLIATGTAQIINFPGGEKKAE